MQRDGWSVLARVSVLYGLVSRSRGVRARLGHPGNPRDRSRRRLDGWMLRPLLLLGGIWPCRSLPVGFLPPTRQTNPLIQAIGRLCECSGMSLDSSGPYELLRLLRVVGS